MAKLWVTVDDPESYDSLVEFAAEATRLAHLETVGNAFKLSVDRMNPDDGYYQYFLDIPADQLAAVLDAGMPTLAGCVVDVETEEQADLVETLGYGIGDIDEPTPEP